MRNLAKNLATRDRTDFNAIPFIQLKINPQHSAIDCPIIHYYTYILRRGQTRLAEVLPLVDMFRNRGVEIDISFYHIQYFFEENIVAVRNRSVVKIEAQSTCTALGGNSLGTSDIPPWRWHNP